MSRKGVFESATFMNDKLLVVDSAEQIRRSLEKFGMLHEKRNFRVDMDKCKLLEGDGELGRKELDPRCK